MRENDRERDKGDRGNSREGEKMIEKETSGTEEIAEKEGK